MSAIARLMRLPFCALKLKEIAVSKPQAIVTRSQIATYARAVPARTSWPWRLAAVVAMSTQMVAALCGVLLAFYWLVATIALSA